MYRFKSSCNLLILSYNNVGYNVVILAIRVNSFHLMNATNLTFHHFTEYVCP